MQMIQPICGTKPLLATQKSSQNPADSRWQVLIDLVQARTAFGLNDRDLAVLRGLISCLSKADARKTFVFASNITLSNRTDGMNERTLRRHLARLIAVGLITRHNSPNGKRYVRRTHLGDGVHAFGFDLTPLFARHAEISDAADMLRQEADAVAILREQLSLLRQSLCATNAKLADDLRKLLRRALDRQTLLAIIERVKLQVPDKALDTMILSGDDSQIVRHKQKSIKDLEDCKNCLDQESVEKKETPLGPNIVVNTLPSLPSVIEACPESCGYITDAVKSWADLIRFTDMIAPMLQIDRHLMETARQTMGAAAAAVTIMCIIQMGNRIRSAAAYLRGLSKRAAAGVFSAYRMVSALLLLQSRAVGLA